MPAATAGTAPTDARLAELVVPDHRNWYQRNRMAIVPWFFLAPAIFFFMVYVIVPIFESLWISLYEWDGLYRPDGTWTAEWVGASAGYEGC